VFVSGCRGGWGGEGEARVSLRSLRVGGLRSNERMVTENGGWN